jgi:imidazolonepropionase
MTTIVDFGSMDHLPKINADKTIDATGKWFTLLCDSHTHIVYGNREQEFVDRINGMTYEEIANRGGGILNSAKKLNETAEEEFTINQKLGSKK